MGMPSPAGGEGVVWAMAYITAVRLKTEQI